MAPKDLKYDLKYHFGVFKYKNENFYKWIANIRLFGTLEYE